MADPPWRQALDKHAEADQRLRHDLADRVNAAIAGHVADRETSLKDHEHRIRRLESWRDQQQGVRSLLTILGIGAGIVSALLVIWDRLSG